MLASVAMLLRASLFGVLLVLGGSACGHGPGGNLAVDIPVLPYLAPDIDEITGMEPADDEDDKAVKDKDKDKKGTEPAPAPTPPAPKK